MGNGITTDDILGKQAVDSEGGILGVILKLHVDPVKKIFTGLTVDQGFLKPFLFIGIDLVANFGVDAVFLNVVPPDKYIGMEVLSPDGRIVGKVKSVKSSGNILSEITVSLSGAGLKKETATIGASRILEIGARVVLKESSW